MGHVVRFFHISSAILNFHITGDVKTLTRFLVTESLIPSNKVVGSFMYYLNLWYIMTKALHSKTCTIFILLFGFHYCNADDKHTEFTTSSTSGSDHGLGADNVFIKDLFAKYGQGGHMTYEGFEHLISSIGLGQIAIKDHILSKHKQDDGEFRDFHPDHHHREHLDNDSSHSHADHDRGSSDSHDHTSQRTSREVVNCHGKECMKKCLPPETILSSLGLADHSYINVNDFIKVCPALISQLDSGVCQKSITEVEPYHLMMNVSSSSGPSPAMVWGCSFGAVAFISLIGLVCVILIPILHKSFYHALLQLLVAMAVGTLTGDALLHLLPHAFSSHEHQGSEDAQDQESIWRGLVVLSGFYVFFNVERLLSIVVDKRQAQREKRKQKKLEETPGKDEIEVKESCGSCSDLTMVVHTSKGIRKMAADAHEDWHVLNNIPCTKGMSPSSSNEHLPVSTDPKYCQPTECGGEIHDCHTPMLTPCTEVSNLELCDDTCRRHSVGDTKDSSAFLHSNKDASKVDDHHHDKDHHDDHHGHGLEGQRKVHSHGHSDGHDHDHEHGKGHGHSHGHSHHVPKSVSSVAWMVIMGDGLHNFCDGMAVGAAFTTGLGGGLSTTVAILCHELPHELGDFAMLLQAGMTVKQAVVYNLASSILCVLGMVLGVLLGNISDASLWLFALTGGMFIYIALVDMLPELTAAYNGTKNPYHQLLVQNIGLLIGMSFMLLISLYEDSFLLDF